jgi:hypothetical protein
MSFNLIYADKGIDLSGFAEGVANGMKMRYEQEKYERKLFDDEMKQFQLTWKPDKLKPGDKSEYMNALDEYKNARKLELRLDKNWKTKPEDRQLAYESAEKAKAKVGQLYTSSQKANQWMINADNYYETLDKKNIVKPTESLKLYQQIRDTPSSQIDWKTIQTADAFDVMPSADEMSKHLTSLTDAKNFDQPLKEVDASTPKRTLPDVGIPLLKNIGTTTYNLYKVAAPEKAYALAKNSTDGNILQNKKNSNFNEFTRALNSEPSSKIRIDADKKADEISKITKVPVSSIDANHLWAYDTGLYNKKYVGKEEDKSEITNALAALGAMNEAERLKISKQLASIQAKSAQGNEELMRVAKWASLTSSGNIVALIRTSKPDSELYKLAKDMGVDDLNELANQIEASKKTGGLDWEQTMNLLNVPKKN